MSEPDSIPPPFTAGARAFDYEYADDFRDFGPAELTEAEEDYRSRAYEAALPPGQLPSHAPPPA